MSLKASARYAIVLRAVPRNTSITNSSACGHCTTQASFATAIWKRPAPIWDWSTTIRNTFLRRLPDLLQSLPYCDPKSGQPTTDTALVVPELHGLRVRRFGLDGLRTLHGARTRVSPKCIPGADVLAARRSDAIYPNHLLRPVDALSGRQCLQVRTMAPYYTLIRRPRKGAVFI